VGDSECATGPFTECNTLGVFYWSIEIRVNARVHLRQSQTMHSGLRDAFFFASALRETGAFETQRSQPGWEHGGFVEFCDADLCIVGSLAFGLLAAYGISRRILLMRPRTRHVVVVKARASGQPVVRKGLPSPIPAISPLRRFRTGGATIASWRPGPTCLRPLTWAFSSTWVGEVHRNLAHSWFFASLIAPWCHRLLCTPGARARVVCLLRCPAQVGVQHALNEDVGFSRCRQGWLLTQQGSS